MTITTVEFAAAAGHQAALDEVLTQLAEGYRRVGTQVQLFRPVTGAMASYLAIFRFESLAAYAAWREALAQDPGIRTALGAFRDHVERWDVAVYDEVRGVDGEA
ncbi:MAG: NIPSNAP family protein [Firmicutes bacterium]|nr:NIPSNAP family protein [Bacillota bacterium]